MPDSSDIRTSQNKHKLLPNGAQGFYRLSIAIVIFLALLAVFMLTFTNRLRENQGFDSVRIESILDAKEHLSEFHLWLEEYLTGDPSIDINNIFHNVKEIKKHSIIITDGGITERGERLKANDDPELVEMQKIFLALTMEFSELAKQRIANPKTSGIGTPLDAQFDTLFLKILQQGDNIEFYLDRHKSSNSAQYNRFFWAIIIIWAFASIAAVIVILRMEKRRALISTARDKATDDLRESEKKFRTCIETANDAIFFADIETSIITDMNSKACELLGKERDEIIGMHQSELHPKEEADRYRAIFEKAARDGAALIMDVDIVRKDGERVPVEISSSILDIGERRIILGIFRDVSERKEAEEELKLQSEIANNMAEGTHIIRFSDGVIIYANPRLEDMFGYKSGELNGKHISILNDPNDSTQKNIVRNIFEALKSRGAWEGETQNVKKDGASFYCHSTVSIFNHPKYGDVAVTVQSDITERKRAEDALNQYRHIVSSSSDMMAILDDNFIYLAANKAYTDAFNLSGDELIGHSVPEILGQEFFDRVIKIKAIRTLTGVETRFQEWFDFQAYDHKKYMDVTYSPYVDSNGVIKGFVVNARDITERKLVEDKLKESAFFLKESQRIANIGTYVFNAKDGTWRSSKVLDNIFGIDESYKKDIEGWIEIVCPEDRDEMARYLKEDVLSKHGSFDREYCIMLGNKKRLVHGLGELVFDENGEVTQMIGTIQDITERKEMENELLKTEKLESLGVLAGGIAHDFNNLLGTILGNVSYAKGLAQEDDEIYTSMTESEKAIRRARDLTQQLLTFSRGGEPVKKVIPIGELIRDSAHFALIGSNVVLKTSISPDLNNVEMDEGQLNQVIHNIIINAAQAMPEGGKVEVKAHNKTLKSDDHLSIDSGSYVKISIKDTGTGISQENLSKIFDPFFTTKQMGSGLGLATAYTIIKNHHGHIDIASEVGKGTTFEIYLPASSEKSEEKEMESDDFIEGDGRVLVMDDEESIRNLTCKILKRLGYEAESTVNGNETIEIFKNAFESGKGFDIVILDLTIPGGMGGQECITELLNINPGVKAIISSGYSNNKILTAFKEYGFKAFIKKPYSMATLSKILHKVLEGK